MPNTTDLVISRRFCGPPDSGNGGYCAGAVASFLDGPVEVTLRRPPPLETPLSVEVTDEVWVRAGNDVIAEGRRAALDIDVPAPCSFAEAEAHSKSFVGFDDRPFMTCFVCGPLRAAGDGLRIFPGSMRDGVVAAPWIPDASLRGENGKIDARFLWAALDCPGYFAIGVPNLLAVLGRMTARVDPVIDSGERCVILGFLLGQEGRKFSVGTALFNESGRLCGRAKQIWVKL